MKLIAILIVGTILLIGAAIAVFAINQHNIPISWDPSPSPTNDISGYVLYTSSSATNQGVGVFVGMTTSNIISLPNGVWYLTVTCKSATNNIESEPSNILRLVVLPGTGGLKTP